MERYTKKQLEKVFDLVKDKKHWKNPINAKVDRTDPHILGLDDVDVIAEAVISFTGSVPYIKLSKNKKYLHVKADGYYRAIGA
jgi:hypothetical protein